MSSADAALQLVDPMGFDGDEFHLRTRERWMTSYSTKALKQGLQIDARIVRHDPFNNWLGAMDRMFLLSKELRQPVGAVMSGPAGSGKTTLCRYFMETLPQHDLAERSKAVIYVRMRRGGALGNVIQQVLQQLRYPLLKVTSQTLDAKRSLSIDAIRRHQTRFVLIDEGHHSLLKRGAGSESSATSEYLCEVMDEAQTAVAIVGGSSLSNLKHTDPYLASRCAVDEQLRDFEFGADWLGIAHAILPGNEIVNLQGIQSSREGQQALHKTARGNLRRLKQFVTELTMVTLDAGKSSSQSALLQLSFSRAFGSEESSNSPWS
jgi:hypothetical protein